MSTTKNIKLAKTLKVILDIIFGTLVFACAALVLWTALAGLLTSIEGFKNTVSIPVILGSGDEPQFEVTFNGPPNDTITDSRISEAEGTLFLETKSTWLVVISNASKLLYALGLTLIFYLLRTVVQAILDGEPFTLENGRRIRRLGYSVLLVGFLGPLAEYIAANEILNLLPTMVPELHPGPTFNAQTILIALFVLLLAHIWSYGLDLERERALTI